MDFKCQVARMFYYIFPRFTEPYESIFYYYGPSCYAGYSSWRCLKFCWNLNEKEKSKNIFLWSFCKLVPLLGMNKFTSQWPVRNVVCQQFYSGKYLMHVKEFQSASRPAEVEEFIYAWWRCVFLACSTALKLRGHYIMMSRPESK